MILSEGSGKRGGGRGELRDTAKLLVLPTCMLGAILSA